MAVVKDLSRGIITMSAADDEIAGEFTPSFFRYIGATTAGHTAVLKDQAEEHTVFESEANGANYTDLVSYVSNKTINGFYLTTLGSGKVEIHLR